MFLLCALIAGSSGAWAVDYELYSGTITEGDYVIYYNGKAMKNTIDANRLQYTEVTPDENTISDPDASIVWHIAASGDYWTIYNAAVSKYAGSTGSKNQAALLGEVSDNAKWTVTEPASGTYEFENLARKSGSNPDNKWLRNNGTYGFACYASATGGALSLYKKSAAAPTKVSKPSISGNEAFLTSTTVSISCGTEGATIKYSKNGGHTWVNYSVPFIVNETATVMAYATKSGLSDSDQASKTFTKVTPITVTAALAAIDDLADNETIEDQCVAGIISQVVSYGSNAITYWISDDGTTTSQLEVFKGKGLNGANFTDKTDLNVGDQVTVFGTLKKYVSGTNTTPEFDAGSQLLSYEATGTPTPAINASNVTIDSEATSGEITYTIDNPTAASLTAAVKEGDWISGINVTADKVTFSVTQNDGEQRIGYITLSYEGATSKDVKVTQKASYGIAKLPFAFDGGKADVETTLGLTHTGLGSDYSYSPKLKFDGAGDELILKINDNPSVLTFDIKGNSFSEGTFTVQTSADGVTYTNLKSYTELDAVSHESFNLASTVRYIKWIYTNKASGNVGIGRIGVDCEAAYIPSAGYATYTTPNNVDFAGTGITAYKVSAIGADNVTLAEITEAPAGTPLILKAAAGNYCLNIIASAAEVTGNKLEVSDGSITTTDGTTVYALASKGEPAVVGFYKVKAGTKVPAGKCYLSVAATSAPDFLGFGDGNTTSMSEELRVKSEEFATAPVYNLNGQRVAQPTKGLYIVNGKKVIIK